MTIDLSVDSPESVAWQQERDVATQAHLHALPAYERLLARLPELLVDGRRAPLVRRGDRWFQTTVVEPTAEHPVLVVRSAPDGEPRVLVDPNELSAKRGVPVTLMWSSPSPDGSLVAYAIAAAGTERTELGLIDVATGAELPDRFPWSVQHQVSWLPDSSGFWCNGRDVDGGSHAFSLYEVALGEPLPEPYRGLPEDLLFPYPEVSPDGRVVLIKTGNTEIRADYAVVDGEIRPLLLGVPGTAVVRFLGEDLVAVVDGDAPRGRLVRIPVATAGDSSTWTELIAESDDVLRWVEVVDDAIVVGYLRDASCGVRVLDQDGALLDELKLPGRGVVSTVAYGAAHPALPMFATGAGEISFIFSSFERSPAVYRYLVGERRLELVEPPATVLEGLTVRTVLARSTDGAEVPAHVVHRADLDLSVPQPTLLYGYGGFNLAEIPSYLGPLGAWVEAGGVYVLAHLRGGSELGREWWEGGRREHKQRTFDDLYAVAERLVELGITTPQQLALRGESNGGLLTGAAVVQRPELWAAVSCDVPILDLLGFHRDPFTFAIGHVEYGNPLDAAEAEWLRAISPVHNVTPARFPALLVSAGANDPRCPTWHSRVFVDLLEKAQQGEKPLLLRVHADQGHGNAGLAAAAAGTAEWIALMASETGLTI